jgi:sensor histidine kinase YesM
MDDPAQSIEKNILLKFLIQPRYRILRHFILILFLVAVLYKSVPRMAEPFDFYMRLGRLLLLLALFYLNIYLLVPKYLFHNRYAGYAISILVLIGISLLLFYFGKNFLSLHIKPVYEKRNDSFNVFGFIFLFGVLIAASTAVRLFQRWVLDGQRLRELEKLHAETELKQLKNQINPHFLFNMLNNAHVLTKKDPEKASQVLLKLSDLLRYELYDSSREKVLLTAEISFLTDFLNLEKIRRDYFEFTVTKEGEIGHVQVPPLLFIPFVENAVKHNMDVENSSYVYLYFELRQGTLHFKCINSKPRIPMAKQTSGGLGLVNVKRTLELLYPGRHKLTISEESSKYIIELTIRL